MNNDTWNFDERIKNVHNLYEQKKFADALRLIEYLLNQGIPQKIDMLYLKGDILFDINCFSESEETYTEILNKIKSDVAYNNRGWARWEQGKHSEALLDFQAAILQNPLHYIAFYAAGEMLLKLDKPGDAKLYCIAALGIRPDYQNALELKKDITRILQGKQNDEETKKQKTHEDIGDERAVLKAIEIKHNQGGTSEALKDIDKAILDKKFSNDTVEELFFLKADILFDCKEYIAAKEIFDYLLSVNNENATALINRGYAKFLLRELQSSLLDYQSAILVDPIRDGAYYGAGRVYSKMLDYKMAKRYCEMALKIDPNYEEYKRFFSFLNDKEINRSYPSQRNHPQANQ
jgi:tetratricopeptide (TPR) repeat protein